MSRTLNGEPLPDDCPCVVAEIVTTQRVGGRQVRSTHEELRPLTGCPHHGEQPGAVDEPVPPVGEETDTNGHG